jgi:predicted patatin/cPLA2 family phospholipase
MIEIHHEGNAEKVFADIRANLKMAEVVSCEGTESFKIHRPVLLVLGGTMRGVYAGGGVIALREYFLQNAFSAVVGVSTGAPGVAYFASGDPKMGTSIYLEECLSKNFINFWKILQNKSIVNISYINDVFRGKISGSEYKKLNIENIKNSKTKVFTAMTNYETGEGELVNILDLDDPVSGIQASTAIPILYKESVFLQNEKIKGKTRYLDGMIGAVFPVQQIFTDLKPTSLLVFANRSKEFKNVWYEDFFHKIVSYFLPKNLRHKYINSHIEFDENLEFLRKQKEIPYTIIWTDDSVLNITKDKIKLEKARDDFYNYVKVLCEKYLK